jgi:hypothetical protein
MLLRSTLLAAGAAICCVAAGPAHAATLQYPDLQTVIPTTSFSIVQTPTGRELRYTHLVYNAGPGPLEIQPQYSQSSGNYQGRQQIYAHDPGGAWTLGKQVRVPDAFVFHAEHGHFHFPLAGFGLYTVAPGDGIGSPVAVSPKNGFCIADSYTYDSTVPNAGTFVGSQGSCADPTTLRGLSVGAADEYDYRDPGQAVPIDGVPDGTYWFRAFTDPDNDFQEADEANNETDVKLTLADDHITVGEVRHPDTTPPAVTLTAPTDGARIKGLVTMSASTAGDGPVQYLVDGNPAVMSGGGWDTTTVVDGQHWLAARTTDAQGRTNTSAVVSVTVANSDPSAGGPFAIDASVSQDGRGTQTTPPLTTSTGGELLLCFAASDGPVGQTVTVSGGGLKWSPVRRADTRAGDAEIWQAVAPAALSGATFTATQSSGGYDQSLEVVAFTGAGGVGASTGVGAASGGPTANVTTTAAGSWVFGVGNDWDRGVARTLRAGQSLEHQWVDTGTGDTFWMQRQTTPAGAAGSVVPISDIAPTGDQWNLAAVEVLAGSPPPPDTLAPTVSVTDPEAGATIGGIVRLGATAADNVGVTKVQFALDGSPLGPSVTAPPFAMSWDTRAVTAGHHTITAEAFDAAGNHSLSSSVDVTVDNSAVPRATISIDASVNKRARSTLTAPALTTPTAGDEIVAFVSHDGPPGAAAQRSTVSGGGLSWTLVKRSDTQSGVSEIWAAKATGRLSGAVVTATPLRAGYDGMLTVVAFKNAAGTGVAGTTGGPAGAPDIYLPGVQPGSWVFAVGNDWDRATARTPVAGQVLRQQWLDTATGDTFWLQSTAAPNAALDLVTIHDDAPTNDQFNYAAVEITAAPGG